MVCRIHLFPASESAMMWASSGLSLLRLWAKITPLSLVSVKCFCCSNSGVTNQAETETNSGVTNQAETLILGLFSCFLITVPSSCKNKVFVLLIKAQGALCGRQQASGEAGSDGRLGDLFRRSAILLPKRHVPYLWVMFPSSSSSGWYNETWSENSWWTA